MTTSTPQSSLTFPDSPSCEEPRVLKPRILGPFTFISSEKLAKLERIAELAWEEANSSYAHTGSRRYNLKHLCIDLLCIDAR